MGTPDEASVREAIERDVKKRVDAGDLDGAATAALRGYGPEILGVLCALHRDKEDAADAFAVFSERLWRGLPSFEWQCTLRTWAYTLARNTSYSHLRGARRRRTGRPLSEASVAQRVAHQVRTATMTWMRTETKDRFARLRESLPAEDQMLLMLRVDRGLKWSELARVLSEAEAPDEAALKRDALALRKRFERLKAKLVEMAKREGLVPPKED